MSRAGSNGSASELVRDSTCRGAFKECPHSTVTSVRNTDTRNTIPVPSCSRHSRTECFCTCLNFVFFVVFFAKDVTEL